MKFKRAFTIVEGYGSGKLNFVKYDGKNLIVDGESIELKNFYTKPEKGFNVLLPIIKKYGLKSETFSKYNKEKQNEPRISTAILDIKMISDGIELGGYTLLYLFWDRMKKISAVVQQSNETKDQSLDRAEALIKNIAGKPVTPKKEKPIKNTEFYSDPHAIGTVHKYKSNGFAKDIVHTDGVKVMVEKLQCHWLLDIIVSYRREMIKSGETFITAKVIKNATGNGAKFTMDDGNGRVFITQRIPFTDITENVKLFVVYDGTYWTIMLPSEY